MATPRTHLTSLRSHLQRALSVDLVATEGAVLRGEKPTLTALEESARVVVREVGRLYEAIHGTERPQLPEWWRCSSCFAKLAGVSAQTVCIARADVQVEIARQPGAVIVARCPRCGTSQPFTG